MTINMKENIWLDENVFDDEICKFNDTEKEILTNKIPPSNIKIVYCPNEYAMDLMDNNWKDDYLIIDHSTDIGKIMEKIKNNSDKNILCNDESIYNLLLSLAIAGNNILDYASMMAKSGNDERRVINAYECIKRNILNCVEDIINDSVNKNNSIDFTSDKSYRIDESELDTLMSSTLTFWNIDKELNLNDATENDVVDFIRVIKENFTKLISNMFIAAYRLSHSDFKTVGLSNNDVCNNDDPNERKWIAKWKNYISNPAISNICNQIKNETEDISASLVSFQLYNFIKYSLTKKPKIHVETIDVKNLSSNSINFPSEIYRVKESLNLLSNLLMDINFTNNF